MRKESGFMSDNQLKIRFVRFERTGCMKVLSDREYQCRSCNIIEKLAMIIVDRAQVLIVATCSSGGSISEYGYD